MKRNDRDLSAEKLWSKELTRHAPLDRETTLALFKAREEASPEQRVKIDSLIIEGNLRLIMKIARQYSKSGQKLLDLCQDGYAGAQHAIEKFDWRRNVSFPTYASWWIRQAIAHSSRTNGKDVRLPAHAQTALKELNQLETGKDDSELKSSDVVLDAVKYARREVSISAPAVSHRDGSADATLGDFLKDESPSPEQRVLNVELREIIRSALEDLTEPELIALKMRFGLVEM